MKHTLKKKFISVIMALFIVLSYSISSVSSVAEAAEVGDGIETTDTSENSDSEYTDTDEFTGITERVEDTETPEDITAETGVQSSDTEDTTETADVSDSDNETDTSTKQENVENPANVDTPDKHDVSDKQDDESDADVVSDSLIETNDNSDSLDAEKEDGESERSLHALITERNSTAEVSVLTSADESDVSVRPTSGIQAEEGLEVIKAYMFGERADNPEDDIWVKADPNERVSLEECETLSLYTIKNNTVDDVIVEDISEDSAPYAIDEDVTGVALVKDTGYRHLNLELDASEEKDDVVEEEVEVHSNTDAELHSETDAEEKDDDEIQDKVVTLDGMMPKAVSAVAIDVTEKREAEELKEEEEAATITDADGETSSTTDAKTIVAAYDISLTDGDTEYQPDEEHPIDVEIYDQRILKNADIELWHIKDNGEEEKITDFTVEDGKVSFTAVGFSVYKIVEDEDVVPYDDPNVGWKKVQTLEELAGYIADGEGILISHIGDNKGACFFKNVINTSSSGTGLSGKRTGIAKTTAKTRAEDAVAIGAKPYYFETASGSNKYYMYCYDDDGVKQYVRNHKLDGNKYNSLDYVTNKSDATVFELSNHKNYDADQNIYVFDVKGNNGYYVNMRNKGSEFCAWNDADDVNAQICFWHYNAPPKDPYNLDGKTYGLMNYDGGTHGYGLMAEDKNVHSMVQLVTRQSLASADGSVLFVDEGSEITRWTFHSTSQDLYKLSAETKNGVKYLALDGDNIVLVASADDATEFKVSPSNDGQIQISKDEKYIVFNPSNAEGEKPGNFVVSASISEMNSWFRFVDFTTLSDDDLITYSADRISVSDIVDGQKVIIYTRIWNEDNKRYDMYAVDHNGSLYPCYASGGKILWLGDGTGSLEWEFTEYLDSVTKEPNYYYELYNSYSEKYIAPQLGINQVLSEDTIGINLPGRRDGEFYSKIIAWDESRYAYIGLKPNDEKTKLVTCAESVAIPFYFATLEELNLNDKLHEIATVDNHDHGITMKMFDFNGGTNLALTDVTADYFDGDYSNKQGLLRTELEYATVGDASATDAGYPIIDKNGKSFKDMYADATEVNHLFIESVYRSSGYFEFDSCQNYATLVGSTNGDFTVYRELGTTDQDARTTLQHGQFFPYNTITAGAYASKSKQNMYDMDALYNNTTLGELDDTDPRKYEALHKIQGTIDYFFGMEMAATFAQTASGLDAWGHDIIFEFTGDDDFWLYVDGELVIDLGGTHSAESGSVNFRTGEVKYDLVNQKNSDRIHTTTTLKEIFRQNYEKRGYTEDQITAKLNEIFTDNGHGQYIFKDYTTHTMRVFYMERGAGASNLHMKFNLASVTPGNVVISKKIEGEGKDSLDMDFLEYPFQIYYRLPADDNNPDDDWFPLTDYDPDYPDIGVSYQNSNQPVRFASVYNPPGYELSQAYTNVFFINPTKNAEISFPDVAIEYRIVECAVDSTVYDKVLINGQPVPANQIEQNGRLISYSSVPDSAENKPTISFENYVNKDVIRDLRIIKEVVDENNQPIPDNHDTFSYRLRVSSVGVGDGEDIPLADMATYYVLAPEGDKDMICRRNHDTGTFEKTTLEYNSDNIELVESGGVDGLIIDDIAFKTSGFGAIANIPAGYTICVPGIPVGSVFEVDEDTKSGYGLMGYEMIKGFTQDSEGTITQVPSYALYRTTQNNSGIVIAGYDPQMKVINKQGYGLTVNKKWSDIELTTGHEDVYVAVYVDGTLLANSVRKIESPATSTYYFWPTLEPESDGTPRSDLTGYVVKEVTISDGAPTFDENGKLTNGVEPVFDENGNITNDVTVTALDSGSEIALTATRTAKATPEGENPDAQYTYVVSYEEGDMDGSSREDTVKNTRKGGIAIRLFKWNSNNPLKEGTFTLKDASGKTIGNYTSDSEGIVEMLYSFERNQIYTLEQTSAPAGYVGLQKKLCFRVNDDDTISLFYDDGEVWGTEDAKDIKWADTKPGANGITAYVDVYNKPFNFIIAKVDKDDETNFLDGAHFALHKRVYTSISGYVKGKDPIDGFEDMVTENGHVDVCGGNSGRVLKPSKNGSSYFLEETVAPDNYAKLEEDIIFALSPIGVPSIIQGEDQGTLVQTEDSYIFTLNVPNAQEFEVTITKAIDGSMGDKTKEFDFTFSVDGDDGSAKTYSWTKNGVEQTEKIKSGDSFKMTHNDVVVIKVPEGTTVTVSEDVEDYEPKCRINSESFVAGSSLTETINDNTEMDFKNVLNGIIPTGIFISYGIMVAAGAAIFLFMLTLRRRRRRLEEELKQQK